MVPSADPPALSIEQLADLYIESVLSDAHLFRSGGAVASPAASAEADVRVGDLWVTTGSADWPPSLVLITWKGEDRLRAVAVIDEPALAGGNDLILSKEQSPLGVPLVCCSWRDIPISTRSLATLAGAIPENAIEAVAMLLQRQLAGGFTLQMLAPLRLSSGESAMGWRIRAKASSERRCDFVGGYPIVRASDARLRVRELIREGTTHLESEALEHIEGELSFDAANPALETAALRLEIADVPLPFQHPRLVALRAALPALAAAAAGETVLSAAVAPGQQVTLTLDREGIGDVVNTIVDFDRVAIVVTSADGHPIPIGRRGDQPSLMLVLEREHRERIWSPAFLGTTHELVLAIFADAHLE